MAFKTGAVMAVQSTTVPQPLFGSWITAGIGAPSSGPLTLTLGTQTISPNNDAASLFSASEKVLLVEANGTNIEEAFVTSISGNQLVLGVYQGNPVTSLTHTSGAFGTGTFIIPRREVNNVFIACEDGNAGQWFYIGHAYNMTASFRRIVKLPKVATNQMPFNYGATLNAGINPFDIAELWCLGTTTSDQYNVAFGVV